MTTLVAINLVVEYDNTGTVTGNAMGEACRFTGMTAAAAGALSNNKLATGGETDNHIWVQTQAYFDRELSPMPDKLASGATLAVQVLNTDSGKLVAVTLTKG